MFFRLLPKLAFGFVPLVALVACGDDTSSTPATTTGDGGTTASGACPAAPAPQKLAGSCGEVTIESPPVVSNVPRHVPENTALSFCSNPPSSGDHYPQWAAFQEFTVPVDWGYLVHSMEHGGVVLTYKCDPPGCPEIVDALKKVRDEAAPDSACPGGDRRIVIAPSATIRTKVAAAAWGKTYAADCVDAASLAAFIRDNYNKGPEDTCAPGRTF